MTPAPVIIDTNVVVAGILTARAASPVARILDGMLRGAFPFVVSEVLLAEYRDVLLRPRVRAAHGLEHHEVDVILTEIALHAIVLEPMTAAPAPGPGDQLLWDLLAARDDLVLVTGDGLLLEDPGMAGRIVSANAFAEERLGKRV